METRGRNNFARYKNTNVGQSGNSTYLSNHRSFCTTVEGWEDSTRCRTKDGLQRLLLVVNPLFKLKKRVHYWRFDCDAMMIQYIRHVTRLAHWKRCTWTIMHCFSKNMWIVTETVFDSKPTLNFNHSILQCIFVYFCVFVTCSTSYRLYDTLLGSWNVCRNKVFQLIYLIPSRCFPTLGQLVLCCIIRVCPDLQNGDSSTRLTFASPLCLHNLTQHSVTPIIHLWRYVYDSVIDDTAVRARWSVIRAVVAAYWSVMGFWYSWQVCFAFRHFGGTCRFHV